MVTWTKRLLLMLLAFLPLNKTFSEDLSFQPIEKHTEDEKDKLFFNEFQKDCEVRRYNHNSFSPLGCLEKLIINGTEIKAEVVVCDPADPTRQMTIAAPIEAVYWNSECPDQSIHLTCRISPQFKSSLLEVLCGAKVKPKVEAQWAIYEYDYSKQKYYRSFHTDDKTILLTIPSGMDKVQISDRFERDAMPVSFSMNMLFASEDKKQKLFFSFQADGKSFSLPISGR